MKEDLESADDNRKREIEKMRLKFEHTSTEQGFRIKELESLLQNERTHSEKLLKDIQVLCLVFLVAQS